MTGLPRHIVGRTAAAPMGLAQPPATVVWPSANPKTDNRGTFSPRPSYQQGRSIGDAASQTHSWKDCRGPSGAGPASSYCGLAERQPTKWIIEAPSPRAPAAQNLLICKQCVQTALANASPPFGRAGGSPSPSVGFGLFGHIVAPRQIYQQGRSIGDPSRGVAVPQ
jgi:hypothetical protein